MPSVRPGWASAWAATTPAPSEWPAEQRVLHADGPHEVVELPLPVGQEVVAAALGVAESRQVHGEHAVVAAEIARDRVPRVARLEEPADQHDRRALRPEALVVREHAARLDESPGRRQRTPGVLLRRRRGVVDGGAARDAERDAEHDDARAFRDALGSEHGLHSNREHSEMSPRLRTLFTSARAGSYC